MAGYLSVPLVLAAAFLQASLSQIGPLSGLKPDFTLVIVATAGMLLSFRQAAIIAALGGIVLDLFSGLPFGFITLILLLVASLMRLPNRDMVELNPLVCMVLVALTTVLYYSVYGLAVMALGGAPDWLYLLATVMLPSVMMNSLLSPFVFFFYRIVGRRVLPVREDWRR